MCLVVLSWTVSAGAAPTLDFGRILGFAFAGQLKEGQNLALSRAPAVPAEILADWSRDGASIVDEFQYDPATRTVAFIARGLPDRAFVVRWDGADRIEILLTIDYSPRFGSVIKGGDSLRLRSDGWLSLRRHQLEARRDEQGSLDLVPSIQTEFFRWRDRFPSFPESSPTALPLRLKLTRALIGNLYLAQTDGLETLLVSVETEPPAISVVAHLDDPLLLKAILTSELIGYIRGGQEYSAFAWRKKWAPDADPGVAFYSRLAGDRLRLIPFAEYQRRAVARPSLTLTEKPQLMLWSKRQLDAAQLAELGMTISPAQSDEGHFGPREASTIHEPYHYAIRWLDDDHAALFAAGRRDPVKTMFLEGPRVRYEIVAGIPPLLLDLFTGNARLLQELYPPGVAFRRLSCETHLLHDSPPW